MSGFPECDKIADPKKREECFTKSKAKKPLNLKKMIGDLVSDFTPKTSTGFPECDKIADPKKREECVAEAKAEKGLSLDRLFRELEKCDTMGGQWRTYCKNQVRQAWIQGIIGPRIYPWSNFRWDYQQFVKNNYDPVKLGLQPKDTSTEGLVRNVGIIIKLVNGLLSDPNPDANSVAGISDQPQPNSPIYPQYIDLKRQVLELKRNPQQNEAKLRALAETIDYLEKSRRLTAKEYGLSVAYEGTFEQPPYEDPFFKDTDKRPVRGKGSSSYYIQTGFCKTTDKEQAQCEKKGHNWIGDQCYKGKYIYLDNTPGIKLGYVKNLEGLLPSLINDATQLSPTNYIGLLQGYNVPGVEIQQCPPEVKETFIPTNRAQISMNIIPWTILIGLVMYLIYQPKL